MNTPICNRENKATANAPERCDQEQASARITRADGSALPPDHHLEYRKDKRQFRMKVTVNIDGGRFVGKRIVIPLHTGDIITARTIRDGIIVALNKAGVLSRRIDDASGSWGDDFEPSEEREDS